MKAKTLLCVLYATGLCGVAPVQAGPVTDAALAVEAKLADGDAAGALSAAGDIYGQVWAQNMAIGFTQGLLVVQY